MSLATVKSVGDFWEVLHAALGLQHRAACLAADGLAEEAAYHERQAIALLLEATCLLSPDEPALHTIRQLATAGLARLHALKRPARPTPVRRARKRASVDRPARPATSPAVTTETRA